jgi:hypothetical protein
MNSQRNKKQIVTYSPETLRTFIVYTYEWIDNLNFTLDPKDCLENYHEYTDIVKGMFLDAGWDGDGTIELMWIPPFMLEQQMSNNTLGVVVWHVKQLEDGISWILHPESLKHKLM